MHSSLVIPSGHSNGTKMPGLEDVFAEGADGWLKKMTSPATQRKNPSTPTVRIKSRDTSYSDRRLRVRAEQLWISDDGTVERAELNQPFAMLLADESRGSLRSVV